MGSGSTPLGDRAAARMRDDLRDAYTLGVLQGFWKEVRTLVFTSIEDNPTMDALAVMVDATERTLDRNPHHG